MVLPIPVLGLPYGENRPTDVLLVAPDGQAGLRMVAFPETVRPSYKLLAWLVPVIVYPVRGRIITSSYYGNINVQGEHALAATAYVRLPSGIGGVLIVMVVAHNSTLYVVIGVEGTQNTLAARRDGLQLTSILGSLTFLSGSVDWSVLPQYYMPSNDWAYLHVPTYPDPDLNRGCFYFDDGYGSVMAGNCG
jgi:hypothetical protein